MTSTHDIYKDNASKYVNSLSQDEIKNLIREDYRYLELISASNDIFKDYIEILKLNKESLYFITYYVDDKIALFKKFLEIYPDLHYQDNVFNFMLMINYETHDEFNKFFDFVFDNTSIFKNNFYLGNIVKTSPFIYTKKQLEVLIKNKYIYCCDAIFGDFEQEADIVSKSMYHHIKQDNDYFYHLFKQVAINNANEHFYVAFEDFFRIPGECFLSNLISYGKLLNLYKELEELNVDEKYLKELINIAIFIGYIEIFNEVEFNYHDFTWRILQNIYKFDLMNIEKIDIIKFAEITYTYFRDDYKKLYHYLGMFKYYEIMMYMNIMPYIKNKLGV